MQLKSSTLPVRSNPPSPGLRFSPSSASASSPVLDFDGDLPPDRHWFSVRELARHWNVSVQHIINLIAEGRFTHANVGPVDFSGDPGRTRATTRIPRACVVAFLQSNKL